MASILNKVRAGIGKLRETREEPHFIVIPEIRLAFGRVPKVANSSIKTAIARHLGFKPTGDLRPTQDRYWIEAAGDRARMVSARAMQEMRADYLVFTFVRSPFDRLVSCYFNKIVEFRSFPEPFARLGFAPNMPFDAFVARVAEIDDTQADTHFQSQASMLASNGAVVADFIGRFETLDADWAQLNDRVEERHGFRFEDLPKRNVHRGSDDDLGGYYASPETVRLTRARYAEDFRLLYPALADPAPQPNA